MKAEPKNNSETKYPQAPLSEVIFGITLKEGKFNHNNLLIDLVSQFKKEGFINIELHQPLSNEKLEGYHFSKSFNPDLVGQVLYRCFDDNKNYLVQIQNNKFLFNWIRNEGEDPANYPGYEYLKNRFFELVTMVEKMYEKVNNENFSINDNTNYCELTYQDRIIWEDYLEKFSDVDNILNHSLPKLFLKSGEDIGPNNEFSNFTFDLTKELNGHGIVFLNTNTSDTNRKQILNFDCSLRGGLQGFESLDQWLGAAHEIQFNTFENFFKEEIREQWMKS